MKILTQLIFTFLTLTSCSKLSTGVYWADTFAISQIDNYFLLNSEQAKQAKAEFKAAFHKTRREEFPKIAQTFAGIALEVEKDQLSEASLEEWMQKMDSVFKNSASNFESMGQNLVDLQISNKFVHFDKKLNSKHKERLKKLNTEEKRMNEARKRVSHVIKETIGVLSKEQELLLASHLSKNPLVLEQENRYWMFSQFQKARDTPVERKNFVSRYFQNWESLHKPEYIAARKAYRKNSLTVILQILRIASPEQKKNLIKNFRNRALEFKKLSMAH